MNLIIQGPIQSIGRGGKSAWLTNEQIEPEDIINFNCENNIINILESYSNLFNEIILVSWRNEIISESFLNKVGKFKNLKLLTCDDQEFLNVPDFNYHGDLATTAVAKNNKLRQFYLIHEALSISTERQGFWLKIRTDQYLDLRAFLEIEYKRGFVYVPKYYPRGFHDFYFISDYESLKKMSQLYVFKHYEFDINLHKDFLLNFVANRNWFYKYLLVLLNNLRLQFSHIFFQRLFILISFLVRHVAEKRYFIELPASIRKSIFWRGQKLKSF